MAKKSTRREFIARATAGAAALSAGGSLISAKAEERLEEMIDARQAPAARVEAVHLLSGQLSGLPSFERPAVVRPVRGLRHLLQVDDEIVELKEWDAVRVPPGTWRGYEAGPEGLEILVIGAPNLGEARREDVAGQRDWWAD